jgi:quercetin dioxygenase-like cupin family protein
MSSGEGASVVSAKGSRIYRFVPADSPDQAHTWQGVPVREYKEAAEHHCGVSRAVLVGASGEKTRFQVRYFEVAAGGYTTLERHQHEHAVVVLRGAGEALLGGEWHVVGFGDTVYIAPDEVHQLRNRGSEPFGFLCIVDSERDRPVVVSS